MGAVGGDHAVVAVEDREEDCSLFNFVFLFLYIFFFNA